MSSDTIDTPQYPSPDDATRIFSPLTLISENDEFGTVVSAVVNPPYNTLFQTNTVTIRILPIGEHAQFESLINKINPYLDTPYCLRYIGVWNVGSETWIVQERREAVSLADLVASVECADFESVLSYVCFHLLLALQMLHKSLTHSYINPKTIFLTPDADVLLSDTALYPTLQSLLSSRRSSPGLKLWPYSKRHQTPASDIWDIGICLLSLTEDPRAISIQYRSGRSLPRFNTNPKYSAQLSAFLHTIFTDTPSPTSLLSHKFVSMSTSTALQAALDEYFKEPLQPQCYSNDVISTLYRQNQVVRCPLLGIDEFESDCFQARKWGSGDRPCVEGNYIRMLKYYKNRVLTTDIERERQVEAAVGRLEHFLDVADMM